MIGLIEGTKQLSSYQPPQAVRELTVKVRQDYAIGERILDEAYLELNYRSIADDENRGQLMFNAFVDTTVEDPNEAWKWRGTRSMARNKGIAMHAQLTANFLLPLFTAQNENDEVDRDFSEVMREIIEWMAQPTNSNYQSAFLQIVFGMITNPVTYLSAEFYEVFQTIKDKQANGEIIKKEVVDDILSGFNAGIWSSSQVLITNAYQRNIQRQRAIITRRWVEHSQLEAKYGDHPNWGFVQPGIRTIYNDADNLFYDVKDEDHLTVVTEETYKNRREDSEIDFINGIYLGDEDVDNNPIKHRDNKNKPKYNIVPFGYHRIGDHFFYYKSMMNAVGWDNAFYDTMSEIVMNRAILEVEVPIAISGTDKIDSEVIFPNAVVTLEDKDARVQKLLPDSNMVVGFNAIGETEKSINKGTLNETISGDLPDASQKAFSVAQAQANAKKLIGAVGKSLAESMVQYGDLMKDIALNHITTPEVDELLGGAMKLKYRSFILDNKVSMGKVVNRELKFDESLIGRTMTEDEQESEALGMLEKTGFPDEKTTLRRINPDLFSKFNYLTRVDIKEMFVKDDEFWQPVLLNLKQILAQDPFIDQEALTRKTMQAFFQSEGDELIRKNPQQPAPQLAPKTEIPKGKETGKSLVNAGI